MDATSSASRSESIPRVLCGIARNLSSNELRDRQREVTDIDAVKLASSDTVDALGMIETAEAEHSYAARSMICRASLREPFVLFYWERKSVERVASALEIRRRPRRSDSSRTQDDPRDLRPRFDTTAAARRPTKAAAAAVVAVIETNGGRVNKTGRKAAAKALTVRMTVAVPAAATAAALAIITGVVWLL